MKATDLDRYGCTIGSRQVKYSDLRRYVCDACGGAVVHCIAWDEEKERSVDVVHCGRCSCEEIILESTYMKQIHDAAEVLTSLPPQFRAIYVQEPKEKISADQAIAELF